MIIDTNNYKNIIFDLGGVILNIDYSLTEKAFSKLGISDFKTLFSQAQQTQLFDNYEKGFISSDEFRTELKKYLPKNITDEEINHAWNAILLDLPEERIKFLKKIKTTHRTFLLSNTNDIHIETLNQYLQKEFAMPDLSTLFEKEYLSYKIGMRKPDAEIFELVLEENNLIASETLFIDDSIQHVEAAKKLGISAYWLDVKKESVLDVIPLPPSKGDKLH
ncbi:MAG TPA: HAD family phosphatase [Bacteroidia bacterium]|nr:HAD family phosphatase [Bacteroidia bacterium]